MLSTIERNKGEINSLKVEFDSKYIRMIIISYLSLVASQSPNPEPGYCCTITTQRRKRHYQSMKQKKPQKARCKQRVKAISEAIFLVMTANGLDIATQVLSHFAFMP